MMVVFPNPMVPFVHHAIRDALPSLQERLTRAESLDWTGLGVITVPWVDLLPTGHRVRFNVAPLDHYIDVETHYA
jgi:hypothetical protein